jgi:hypothetical protein
MPGEPRDVRALLTFVGDVSGTPTNYFDVEPPPGTPRLYPRIRCEVVVHFVDAELRWPHRTGHVCAVRHDAGHRWLYFPAMEVGEALVFKCYSATHGGTVRFGAHTAFVDPTSRDGARTRESIEVRTIAPFR